MTIADLLKTIPLKKIELASGPLLAGAFLFFADLDPSRPQLTRMAAIVIWMSVWWLLEAVPLAVTALIPFIFFPALGIESGTNTAPFYINSTIFLFLGGFILALAMERWHLHRRIALVTVSFFGNDPRFVILGIMSASALLSMWISNTAAAVMMLPVGLSFIEKMEENFGKEKASPVSKALLLGIAYSCSVGGIATLIGTPPNLILARTFAQEFPGAPPVTFGQWILFGLPMSFVLLIFIWFLLAFVFFRISNDMRADKNAIKEELRNLGPAGREEITIMIVFFITALLWMFRSDLRIGDFVLPGWAGLIPWGEMFDDGVIAMAASFLLFVLPAKNLLPDNKEKAAGILDADVFKKIPWSIILLFGGGFALAGGFSKSGLSEYLAGGLNGLSGIHPLLIVFFISLGVSFLTELTSNTASTQLLMPVLASAAIAMKINPLMLMLPAALSASMAFMMPVATPPNAIVFSSERLRIMDMAKTGFIINIAGAFIITAFVFTAGTFLFGFDTAVFPDWAVI